MRDAVGIRTSAASGSLLNQPAVHVLAPLTMLSREGRLIMQLTRREIASRYRGSMLGILWSLLNPLFLLGVYTFVFGGVFRMKWRPGMESTADLLEHQVALVVAKGVVDLLEAI